MRHKTRRRRIRRDRLTGILALPHAPVHNAFRIPVARTEIQPMSDLGKRLEDYEIPGDHVGHTPPFRRGQSCASHNRGTLFIYSHYLAAVFLRNVKRNGHDLAQFALLCIKRGEPHSILLSRCILVYAKPVNIVRQLWEHPLKETETRLFASIRPRTSKSQNFRGRICFSYAF